jgi:hypothetical protein
MQAAIGNLKIHRVRKTTPKHPDGLLPIENCTRALVFSTVGLLNFRFPSTKHTTGKLVSVAPRSDGASARVESTNDALRINALRFMYLNPIKLPKNPVPLFIPKNKTISNRERHIRAFQLKLWIKLAIFEEIPIGQTAYLMFKTRFR